MKYSSFSSCCLLRFSAFFWSPGSKQVHPTLQATTKYSMLLPGNFLFLRETINNFESGKKIKSPFRKSIPNLKQGFHRENRENTSPKSLLRKNTRWLRYPRTLGTSFREIRDLLYLVTYCWPRDPAPVWLQWRHSLDLYPRSFSLQFWIHKRLYPDCWL